jgi:hypothetical protein
LAAAGLRALISEKGLHTTRALINKYSSGNAARTMKILRSIEPKLVPDIYGIFKAEVGAQLEAI